MVEDDIYNSKSKYDRLKGNLILLLLPPTQRKYKGGSVGKYVCKNKINLKYFEALFKHFEAKDLSYIRRIRVLQSMRLICHVITNDLADPSFSCIEVISTYVNTYNGLSSCYIYSQPTNN